MYGLDSTGSGYDLVAGSYEHDSEHLGSIECGECHWPAEQLSYFQEGLCFMELPQFQVCF